MNGPIFLHAYRAGQQLVRGALQTVQLITGGPNAPELACRPLDYTGAHHPRRAFAELKVDGIRCLFIDGRTVTLEGQPMNCARHCIPALVELERLYGEAMMFDGEYVADGGFDETVSEFQKGDGTGTLWLFDAVPMREWLRDTNATPWHERKRVLIERVGQVGSQWVGVLANFAVPTEADAKAKFDELRKLGFEGIVIKDSDAPYSRARCNAWQRMKPHECTDLQLLEIAGDDKRGCRRIICRDRAGTVILTAGWTKDQGALMWLNRNVLTGTAVEVLHAGRTQQGRLRHARFGKLRQDRLLTRRRANG